MRKYLLIGLVVLATLVYVVRFAVPRLVGALVLRAMENGGQLTVATVHCPKCGATLLTNFGGETQCPRCGTALTGCYACGELLLEDQRFRSPVDSKWLCEEHYQEVVKRKSYLDALDKPDMQIQPERKGWTEKVQQFYEARLRLADKQRVEYHQLFPPAQAINFYQHPYRRATVPAAVREAFDFYAFCMGEPGILDVYRVAVDGRDTYLVSAVYSGGSDTWLEVYDTDGAPHGFARTDCGIVLWSTKATVRKHIFDGDLEPEFAAARERRYGHKNRGGGDAVDR